MRKVYFWAALSLTVFITVTCLMSMQNFKNMEVVNNTDKYVHLSFYLLFTVVWYQYLVRKLENSTKFRVRLYTFLWACSYGIGIEICQGAFTKDRSADFHDIIANSSGALLAVAVLWLADKLKK
ncbi:VanZ family protein [Flavobacterium sp. RHBU_24]|uniref:VanZ family protein n=1 Tax=Flavobacterium sp. RHBU_24 TaxID=3391185 RepID=UPI003984F0B8